jgi:predicted dehydrogenase
MSTNGDFVSQSRLPVKIPQENGHWRSPESRCYTGRMVHPSPATPPPNPHTDLSRREFLGHSAKNAAVAGAAAAGVASLAPARPSNSPAERIHVGVIGTRRRGLELATLMASRSDTDVAALCDVDPAVLAAATSPVGEAQGFVPELCDDFRRVLDRPDLDAVVIATPDHHHATMTRLACQAGKDVYLETPVSRTIDESRQMAQLAKESTSVIACGLQQRSGRHFLEAIELIHGGEIGRVRLARAWTVHRGKSIGTRSATEPPAGVDYAAWLGPDYDQPFHPARFHDSWRWFWDFGTGALGRYGVHSLDVARWGLGLQLPTRTSASGGIYHFQDDRQTPDTLCAQFDYPDATIAWEHRLWNSRGHEGRSDGTAFYGELGTLIIDRGGYKIYGRKHAPVADGRPADADHVANFLDCIRSRHTPAADIECGTTSSTLCHLGNLAFRLGRDVHSDTTTHNTDTLADGEPDVTLPQAETGHDRLV